ncbi:MAG TPA: glycosyltransferase family 4 protein [Gaiellaceae bacterium]|nr:glycosyltransferase family 4 protein [Gaiellaceae bacterium]
MKVAYYSPLPPERSGIADYSAMLLPELEKRIDVEVARRGRRRWGRGAPGGDAALYHVGNDPRHHAWVVEELRRRPGVVVLHDFVLHHLIAGMTVGRGDADGYLDAMQREAGVVGRMLAHGVIDGLLPPAWERRAHEYPLTGEVLSYATGVIVHSAYVERRVRDQGFGGPVWRIPLAAWPIPAEVSDAGLPQDRLIVGSFGHLNPAKRVPKLLEGFRRFQERRPEALLLLVGSVAPGVDFELPADGLHFDYVSEDRLWSLLAATDICVSLRYPTMGETSGIAVRALEAGCPQIVSDIGWFSELPDEVALKVPVGGDEVDVLAAHLERLAGDAGLRASMAAAARAHGAREHGLERVAEAYVAALEEAAGGEAVRDAVRRDVAVAASEVGLSPGGPALDEIAEGLRETQRGG